MDGEEMSTHWASPVAVHSEVRAEEQVGDSQEQRLSQWSSSVIIIQLICLKRMHIYACMRLELGDEYQALIKRYCVNSQMEEEHCLAVIAQ